MFDSLLQDLRFSVRQLHRAPIASATIVLTLALGIAANTAVFSLVNAWLLRPLPLKEPNRLVTLWRAAAGNPNEPAYFDLYHDYLVWASESHTLESLAATFTQEFTITGAGEPRQIHGAVATWNLFPTVGAGVERGRLFEAADVDREPSCVISDAFWKSHFGASETVIGQTVKLNDTPYRVIGVLPPNFSLRVLDRPFDVDAWTVITASDPDHGNASPAPVSAIGRLKPGVTIEQASAELNTIQRELNRRFTDEPRDSGVLVAGLQRDNTRTIRSSLLLLLGVVSVLLLIACVNAGSLLLGRNSQRASEFAVRLALGCSAGRLLQQLTTEVLLVFICGGTLGIALAAALLRIFVAANPLGVLPSGGISMDVTVLATTAGMICATALLFGSVPAMRALRLIDANALRSRAATAGRKHLRARMLFVVSEIGLSVLLLVTAALLITSFARLAAEPLGFQTRGVFVGEVGLPSSRYPKPEQQSRFVEELLPKLRELPSAQAVGVTTSWPFQANGLTPIESEGKPRVDASPRAFIFNAGPGFFDAMGIALLQGRGFNDADRQGTPEVAVINDALARAAFAGEDPLGRRIRIGSLSDKEPNEEPWRTVVGVVANARSMRYNRNEWEVQPAIYTAFLQRRESKNAVRRFETQTIYVYVRAQVADTAALAAAAHAIDPDVPVGNLRTTGEIVGQLRAQPRLRAFVTGSFALLTLLLAVVGVYGVLAQMVEQRRREIGIRLALGALSRNIVALIFRRTFALITAGMAGGVVGSIAAARALQGLLYQVSPLDPLTFVVVLITLAMVALAATYIPARRAARIDPNESLRCE